MYYYSLVIVGFALLQTTTQGIRVNYPTKEQQPAAIPEADITA
jgi:hypothetical protein